MANALGGVIFLGVTAERDGSWDRALRPGRGRGDSDAPSRIEPHCPAPELQILRVESEQSGSVGYNLLVVPPSAWRPHAVRVGDSLRYPRRDGPRIRYLFETEVADAYRSRFAAEVSQGVRLAAVNVDGVERLDETGRLWLTAFFRPRESVPLGKGRWSGEVGKGPPDTLDRPRCRCKGDSCGGYFRRNRLVDRCPRVCVYAGPEGGFGTTTTSSCFRLAMPPPSVEIGSTRSSWIR